MIIEQIEENGRIYDKWHSEYPADERSFEMAARVCRGMGTRITCSGNLIVCYSNASSVASRPVTWQRERVGEFSASSASRMGRYLRTCVAQYRTLGTLTYTESYGYDGGKAKRDLKVLLQWLKRQSRGTPGWSVFWFMEFQRRGAIHFHFFCTDYVHYDALARKWYEICGSDDIRHLNAGTQVKALQSGRAGTVSYAGKYAAKHVQKVVPAEIGWIGRFWGVCGLRETVRASTFVNIECSGLRSVVRRVNQLQDALDTAVFHGKARMLHSKRENMELWSVSDDETLTYMKRIIYLMECTISMYYPRSVSYNEPELYEDGDLCL